MLVIDNTKRTQLVDCPEKYRWRFIEHLDSEIGKPKLRYGIALHSAKESFYQHVKERGWFDLDKAIFTSYQAGSDSFDKETSKYPTWYPTHLTKDCLILGLSEFYARYNHLDQVNMVVLHTERKFNIVMNHAYTGEFIFAGKIDMEVTLSGQHFIVDHKSTSNTIAYQLERLNRSPQFMGYQYAAEAIGREITGCLIQMDYVSKTKSGIKYDFGRGIQIFQPHEIEDWRLTLVNSVRNLKRFLKDGYFPRETQNCFKFGECPYLRLCRAAKPNIEDGYIQLENWDDMLLEGDGDHAKC